jgi:hypothetical protein
MSTRDREQRNLPHYKIMRKKLMCLEPQIKEFKARMRERRQCALTMMALTLQLYREELERLYTLSFTPLLLEATWPARANLENEIARIQREMLVLARYL